MGRVEQRRKIARLEARASATRTVLVELAEARRGRLLEEAVGRLTDADLRTLGEIVDAAIEEAQPGTTTDLHRFAAGKLERQALAALGRALRASLGSADGQSKAENELVRGQRHA